MADKNGQFTPSKSTESTYRPRYAPTTDTNIYYPESDGQSMAETERHRDCLIWSIQTLSLHYIDDKDTCVSGNMMMYYEEGNPQKSISPDVFVAFGVGKKERRIYQIWNEGKPPDFVLEFSSSNTNRKDQNEKKHLYAEIGILEYFLYDLEGRVFPKPIMGYRLVEGKYVSIPTDANSSMYSETLGLELCLRGDELGFYDLNNEKWLETPATVATIRVEEAENRAEKEAAARLQAEAELARLREEISLLKSGTTTSENDTNT